MPSYNRVVLMGNLTRDIELRYIPSGTAVADIGLAVNERVKKGDAWVDEANFFDITLFGRTAEIANEYLSKGSCILVEGRLKFEQWEKDGQKRSKVKVIADKMQMLGGNQQEKRQSKPADNYDTHTEYESVPPDDEIPF